MANDTRSGRKTKVGESNTSKKGVVNSKGSSTSGSSTMDTSGLRRSARETSSKKQMISSPSSSLKERPEKRAPTTPPVKKKSERFEKSTSSPLRRSERGKKNPSSSSSGSKESEKGFSPSDTEHKKLKREKSVKQLSLETREVNRNQKQHQKPVGTKKKRMDARSYKASFKLRQSRGALKEIDEETESPDNLSQVDSSIDGVSGSKQAKDEGNVSIERMGKDLREENVERTCEALERSNSSLRNFDPKTLGNYGEVGSSYSKNSCAEEPHEPSDGDGLNGPSSDGIIEETLDDDIDLVTGGKVMPSTRKRHIADMDSNAFSMIAKKDISTSVRDDVSSPSSGCKRNNYVETCVACSKRRRVGYDSPEQELCSCNSTLNEDQCDTCILKDRGELESSITPGLADKCDGNKELESPPDFERDQNMCVICRLGGKLLCCDGKGCKRTFHISCLDPPLNDVPPGVWHCKWCVKKKIDSGVHLVSEGIESIWDTREVEVPDAEGLQRQRQYFVKYKGLAHIHNRWVPETQLHLEAPVLVAKFNRKNQVTMWKKEWTVADRLLKKRLLVFPVHHNWNHSAHAADNSDPHYEWLVKWRGLDYENATWELENASFLFSPHTQRLIREYEHRCQKAKRAALLSRVDKSKIVSSINPPKLPAGVSPGTNNSHLNSVNKLLEYWQKEGQHAVVLDEQERVMKVILFILSLLPEVCQPFLIISPSSALSLWEAGFLRFAPSNVVIYSGNKDTRRCIRTLESCEEGGSIMFEVLLSPPEAVVEDLDMLECIRWEAIIVDECQSSKISAHFGQIKLLATDVRFLLFNGQIRDTAAEHLNQLSLLDSRGDLDSCDVLETDSNDNLSKLKKKLSHIGAYRYKSDSSRFVEYWVPVQISNVQLEQYCATLLSNTFSLRSTSKTDSGHSVEALRDILISTRKCCDHPYLVDPSLQGIITKGLPEVEYLDVGIKASGKLELLDAILSEIKNRQLRIVILFQSIGVSGKVSIGDILDDFLRQRFGPDSYERVDGVGVLPSKKQAALNKFNDKDSGRFVFLLENRACLPSIKLSSVDIIVIFDSDWNPANDLRSLHRISIDSQFEQIKIFRLYSSCTVEEKILILAKHETLDNNLHSISRITSHMLLMWGASYLFNKLDEFHDGSTTASGKNILSEHSFLQDVVKEFLALLSQNAENNYTSNSIISKVQQSGGHYSRSISLLGEVKVNLADGEDPHAFWTKLLERRNPRWKYLSGPTQRNRKRVQYFDQSPKKPEVETGEVGKKRKKVGNDSVDPASLKAGLDEGASGNPVDNVSQSLPRSTACVTGAIYTNYASSSPFSSSNISLSPEIHMVELEERRTVCDAQKSLHLLLKPEISKLCEILELSEDVKVMVGRFLEYVIDNHHVNREPATILQAFQISLCWIGASLLKYKIDRKQSLALAQHHLNFGCTEEEAKNVYSKLRLLKKMFLHCSENLKDSDSSRGSITAVEDITKELLNAKVSESVASCMQDVKLDVGERSHNQEVVDEQVFPQQEHAPKYKVAKKEISRSIKRVQKKCDKRMAKLLQKHDEELQEFNREWEEKRVQLEEQHRLEFALVRSIHSNISVRIDKLKILDNEFAKKLEEHKSQKDIRLKDLKANQLAEKIEESQKASHWLAEVESLAKVELLDTSSERASVSGLEQPNILANSSDGHGNIVFLNLASSEGQIPVSSIQDQVLSSEMPAIARNKVTGAADSTEMATAAVESSIEYDRREESGIITNVIRNQNDTAGSILNGDSLSVELPLQSNIANNRTDKADVIQNATETQNNAGGSSMTCDSVSVEFSLVKSAPVQPVVTPFQGVQLPQALDEGSQFPTFTEMQDGDAPASGNTNLLQQVEVSSLHSVDIGPTFPINLEAPIIEPAEQLQSSPSNNLSLGHSRLDLLPFRRVEHQPRTERHTAMAPQLVELPNQAVLRAGTNLALHPPVDATDVPPRSVQPDLSSTSRVDDQPISEGCNSFQNTGTPLQMAEPTAELPSQAFQQPGTSLGVHLPIETPAGGFGANMPIHIAPQVPSRISTLPLYVDPLQNELDRLQKEIEHSIKVHEDSKLQLRSDCDKEIEEIVAKIRMKYDTKLQDSEAAFLLKRKELDTNRNKVYMNKILAEAFRSKCLDLRPSGTLGMQPAVPSSSMNQLHHLPSQFTSRPSIVTGSSSVCPPTTTQQSTAPPPHFHHPSAPFPSIPTRPPLISPITPPTGNHQVVGEIRAPAPHLQPFRHSTSTSATSIASLPRGIPSNHGPNNLSASSTSGPQAPPPPPPPPPTHHSAPNNRPPHPEIAGMAPALYNPSISALELLMDVDNRPGARPPNILPPMSALDPNFDFLDLSEFGTPGRVSNDVVCLSDDD